MSDYFEVKRNPNIIEIPDGMTNEEASYLLANVDRSDFDEFMNEALDMGIKALEQEPCDYISFPKGTLKKRGKGYVVYNPEWLKENWQTELKVMGIECEDCISRQAVLALKTPVNTTIGWSGYMIDALDIEQLPSVQPKPKTGHWIDHQEGRWIYAQCSECGTVHDTQTNYCPNCGAKMSEILTDSEKE